MAIIIIRTVIIYFTLLITMRFLGKRQLGELELSELVLASLIADIAAHPLQDMGIPMINGIVPALTLFCCEVLITGLSMRHIRLRALFFGKPSIIIKHGCIDQKELLKNRFTLDELMQELRCQGVTDIEDVEYAVIETDGKLSLLLSPAKEAVTAEELNIAAEERGYPYIIISNGRVLEENLNILGKSLSWLKSELIKRGQSDPKQVFLMSLDSSGKIYFAAKERKK